jgi:hypothetical protein
VQSPNADDNDIGGHSWLILVNPRRENSMKYKDFGQGVFATVLLAGATVMFLVSEGSIADQKRASSVPSAVSAEIRQQASENFQRISADSGVRSSASGQPSWVF